MEIERLLAEETGQLGQVFFTNSGAEAVECALKLARKHGGRGRHVVVSTLGSFHGRTLAALAATGQPSKHEPFQPMPEGFHHVAWGDVDAIDKAVDASVAAVLVEPLQGEGGVNVAPPGYLPAIREICDATGALMMVDEVQTGFARTGRWFGFQHDGVVPDVVTLAKAMGNGMPVGACWARNDVAAAFEPGDHGSTYSGTAIATAAVNAVITEMRRLDAPALAATQGAKLAAGLGALPGVAGVRGKGLLLAAELDGHEAPAVYRQLLADGLVTNAVTPTALRFAPPLTVSDEEIDEAVAMVGKALVMTRHFLQVTDLDPSELRAVLDLASLPPAALGRPLDGLGAALIFEKPSTRTRHSMEMAVVQLGGHPVYTQGGEIGIDEREPAEDVVRILQGYHALLAARVFAHELVVRMAAVADVPVVNMLSDRAHPLQALADALTMEQVLGPLAGRTIAWVGDYNNVARSLGEVGAMLGAHLRYACPVGYGADDAEVERLALLGAASVDVGHRPADAVATPTPCTPTHGCRWARRTRRRAQAGVRGLHRRRRSDGARRARRRVHALPPGVPRDRGHRRRHRRSAQRRDPAGPQPPPRRPRAAGVPAGRAPVRHRSDP